MYRHCIYCSARLGGNEALEGFPIGRAIAFDAARGRLWAVCPRCARWNLAPLETRWEPVEAAERLFRDARARVQAENVGLARLRDGTRLVRVGDALPGELAAWRYGGELARRQRGYRWKLELAEAAGIAVSVALQFVMMFPVVNFFVHDELARAQAQRKGPLVHRLGAGDSPTGEPADIHRAHLQGAYLAPDEAGEPALCIPALTPDGAPAYSLLHALRPELDRSPPPFTVRGATAGTLLARAMARVNAPGAPPEVVRAAVDALAVSGDPAAFLDRLARDRTMLTLPRDPWRIPALIDADGDDHEGWAAAYWVRRARMERVPPDERAGWKARAQAAVAGADQADPVRAAALEMALHEAAERRALEGELALLELAWREAEEIAAIADRLTTPTLPPDRR